MSSDIAIHAENISKVHRIYDRPEHRLLQMATIGRVRRFREFSALNGVSLTVHRGETVGIVGRNGCGKSTLLQVVCGILQPTTGTVQTNGRISALLELGAGFDPQFTGRENVFMGGAVLGFTREQMEERFEGIASFAGIGDFMDQPVRTYSSGMYVRLAFATAVSVDPDILVVDEALAVGDEAFQRKCIARIEQIQERGGTLLFVSHSVQSVVSLCSRAILLDGGEKILDGDPKTVTVAYQRLVNAEGPKVGMVRNLIRENRVREAIALTDEEMDAIAAAGRSVEGQSGDGSFFNPGLVSKSTVIYEQRGAEISNVRILNEANEPVNVLSHGYTYRYCYDVKFTDAAESVGFGMLINAPDGLHIGGINTRLSNVRNVRRVEAGENISVSIRFVCRLNPALYFLNAGVQNFDGSEIYFMHRIVDAMLIAVNPISQWAMTSYVNFDFEPQIVRAA